VKKSDGALATTNQLQGSDFIEQIGPATKLSPAAFDSFADAVKITGSPNDKLVQLFELRRRLIQ